MVDTYEEWSVDLIRAEKDLVPGQIIKVHRQLVFLTLGAAVEVAPGRFVRLQGVILMTPVDTGRARASWSVSAGQPSTEGTPPGRRRSGIARARRQAQAALVQVGTYGTVWITSNLPYIEVLEYGLYPDPVALGTWNPRRRRYEIRSASGYSKQAPAGMLRVTVARVMRAVFGPQAA